MNFIQKVATLSRLDALINRKGTGSPTRLADRLQLSERTVYRLIKELTQLGAEISP